MDRREMLLLEFKGAYDRMLEARDTRDKATIVHAERNFYACAEILAKRVPMLLTPRDPELRSVIPGELPPSETGGKRLS